LVLIDNSFDHAKSSVYKLANKAENLPGNQKAEVRKLKWACLPIGMESGRLKRKIKKLKTSTEKSVNCGLL